MEQLFAALKNEKVSTSVFGLLLMVTWIAFTWADAQHGELVTRPEHQREMEEVKQQISALTKAVNQSIDDSYITAAGQLIRDKELQLQLARATGQSEREINHLEEEISAAKRYHACLISVQPNCKHLKPAE